jgi:autoinducer 2-degrading protein
MLSRKLLGGCVVLAAAVAPVAQAQPSRALACQEPGAPQAVVLAVTWRAQEGKEGEVAEVITQLAQASRAEPGILAFVVHRSSSNPHEFFLYEQYRDAAALQAHSETEHFKTLVLARAVPMLAQRNRVQLEVMPCPGR